MATTSKKVATRKRTPPVVQSTNQFDHMIELAITGNADLDKLQQLMEMKVRYDEIEAEKQFNGALSNFQSKQAIIEKDQTGHNDKKYASLAGSLAQVQDLMTENGLSRAWSMVQSEDKIAVTCTITHVSGGKRTATLSAGADMSGNKNAIQGIGSTVSYLERYTFYAALGIASAEMIDDDGSYGSIAAKLEPATAADIKAIRALMKKSETDEQGFVEFLKNSLKLAIEKLEDLPVGRVAEVTGALNAKIKAQENQNGKG